MACVYIIRSREGYIYVGSSTDLDKRLHQHNNKLAGWTKRGNEWSLIYKEEFTTYSDARKREKWFKSGVGRDYIKNNIFPKTNIIPGS
jgi:putative endonuclease